jgi:hypothetical protein
MDGLILFRGFQSFSGVHCPFHSPQSQATARQAGLSSLSYPFSQDDYGTARVLLIWVSDRWRLTTGADRPIDRSYTSRTSFRKRRGRPAPPQVEDATRQTCLREPAGAARELLLTADARRDDTMSSGLAGRREPSRQAFGGRRELGPKGRSSTYWSTCVARFRIQMLPLRISLLCLTDNRPAHMHAPLSVFETWETATTGPCCSWMRLMAVGSCVLRLKITNQETLTVVGLRIDHI